MSDRNNTRYRVWHPSFRYGFARGVARYGIDYDVESWALMAAMEAVRGGVSMPYDAWVEGIRLVKEDGTGVIRLDRLLAHLGVSEAP